MKSRNEICGLARPENFEKIPFARKSKSTHVCQHFVAVSSPNAENACGTAPRMVNMLSLDISGTDTLCVLHPHSTVSRLTSSIMSCMEERKKVMHH